MRRQGGLLIFFLILFLIGFTTDQALAEKKRKNKLKASFLYSYSLALHNAVADRCGVERIKTLERTNKLARQGYLAPVPAETPHYWNAAQPEFRYLLPVAKEFLEEIAREFYSRFGAPLKITEMMRDEEYQKKLVRSRVFGASSNADCRIPSQCTLHFTGLAFDISKMNISKKPMTWKQIKWIVNFLKKAAKRGKISFFPESSNFHVTVHPICLEKPLTILPETGFYFCFNISSKLPH